jgi:hypothetical protein
VNHLSVKPRLLATSVGLSLALHAGGLVSLAHLGTRAVTVAAESQLTISQGFELDRPVPPVVQRPMAEPVVPEPLTPEPEPEPEPEPPPVEEEVVRLGVEDATEERAVWKGSASPTENLAPRSDVDQAALAISPRMGGQQSGQMAPAGSAPQSAPAVEEALPEPARPEVEAGAEAVEAQPPQPVPQQPEEQQPEAVQELEVQPRERQAEPVRADGADLLESLSELVLPGPQPVPRQLEEQQLLARQVEPVQPELMQPLPERPEVVATVEARETAPPPGVEGVNNADAPDAERGKKAEEESPAAAIVGSLVYKPGEPLAGKGLRVFTVRPRYGYATLATASPRNTVVLVTFGRDGRVLRAAFKDKGTGYEEVDKPLIEAVYRWTARGEALGKIPADQPRAGVTFEVRFLMERM